MRRPTTLATVAALVLSLSPAASAGAEASAQASGAIDGAAVPTAVTSSQWRAGNIISDAVFYASNTMTAAQVQTFLDGQGVNCAPGEQPCLKDYRMTTPSRPAESNLCGAYTGAANETAAQIIAKVGRACGINPQVLLVLLQKETSLVTKSRPTTSNYNRATGFGCPDTGPGGTANCDTQYYGFFNQLYRAARQYLIYRNNPTRYAYQAGRTNTILYHPTTACGTEQVHIENQATAGLYIYTPYVPNAAALANWTGTGNSCSSYGNRNFFRIFSNWFGDPRGSGVLVTWPGSSSVYLIDAGVARFVPSVLRTEVRSRLGAVSTIPVALFETYPKGSPWQRMVRNAATGEMAWFSQGRLHAFPSCDVVTAWSGQACGTSAIDVDPAILARMLTGPAIPATSGVNAVAMGHAQGLGWMPWATQGRLIGTTGQSRRLEALTVNLVGAAGSALECRAHVSGVGWGNWVAGGGLCGTTGQSRQVEAVQLRLTGPASSTHTVWYRAHVASRGWLPWTSNSGTAGTTGESRRAEALEIMVRPKSAPPPGTPSVEYRALAGSLGWMSWVRDGALAGTVGQSRRIEALVLRGPSDTPWNGGLECSAHVQNVGWRDWVPERSVCGTEGRSLQLEAVRLRLTGTLAGSSDVWYRVHSQNLGWSGWARNGDPAGTQGRTLRAESVEVRILPRGSAAPGPTANAFRTR